MTYYLIVYELIILIILIIVLFVIYIRRSNNFKKQTNKRINFLFDINKNFYKNKSLKEMADYSLKTFTNSVPKTSFSGLVMCDNEKIEYSETYDVLNGFSKINFSESFINKINEIKIYFRADFQEISLNYPALKNICKSDEFVHVLKFYLEKGKYGAFFFVSKVENIDIYDYEFLRIFVEHFSFGIKMQYLTKKVKSYSKTINILEDTYQKIVDNLPVGLIGINNKDDYKVLIWNELAEDMFDIKEKEDSLSILDLFKTIKNKSILKDLIEHTRQTQDLSEIPCLKYKTKDDGEKYFLILCYPLIDLVSGFDGTILVFRDITETKNLQEKLKLAQEIKEEDMKRKIDAATKELKSANLQLKRMNNLKSEFVSIVSHELRTPLTSIRGYASLLNSERLGKLNTQQKNSIEIINQEGARLSDLINDILDLSKLQAGKVSLDVSNDDLVDTVKKSVRPLKIQAQQKNISLKVTGKRKLFVEHDSEKMNRVFYNIIGNAIKFTQEGGNVTIKILDEKDYALVSVKDNGVGIPKDKLENVFKPFLQIESAMQRQSSGTGLGLTISQHIMELHQGFIHVESEIGNGSNFIIHLPKTFTPPKKRNKK